MADYPLQRDFDYFMSNVSSLYEKYAGRFVVIKDAAVVGDFESADDAYKSACDRFGAGNFSIYECKYADSKSYVQVFNSRVRFA